MSDKLLQLFSDGLQVSVDQLNDESSPDNTKEWDSVAAMNLVSLIEDTFEIELNTKEIMKMRTIGIARKVLTDKGVELS
jgi:acyl carrier protein